jgi:hypothetical protein
MKSLTDEIFAFVAKPKAYRRLSIHLVEGELIFTLRRAVEFRYMDDGDFISERAQYDFWRELMLRDAVQLYNLTHTMLGWRYVVAQIIVMMRQKMSLCIAKELEKQRALTGPTKPG